MLIIDYKLTNRSFTLFVYFIYMLRQLVSFNFLFWFSFHMHCKKMYGKLLYINFLMKQQPKWRGWGRVLNLQSRKTIEDLTLVFAFGGSLIWKQSYNSIQSLGTLHHLDAVVGFVFTPATPSPHFQPQCNVEFGYVSNRAMTFQHCFRG